MGLSKNIAYRLQTLREAAGLSQQELADKADLSLSLITKMEQARKADPRASTIIALAAALGVRPGQLIEDLVPPPDGLFPGKKKKKKKKKALEAALAAAGVGIDSATAEPGTNGTSHEALSAASTALGVLAHEDDGKEKKKKRKDK